MTTREIRLRIRVLIEQGDYAVRQKRKALRRHDDPAAHSWDELKANSRDAAIKLIKELLA